MQRIDTGNTINYRQTPVTTEKAKLLASVSTSLLYHFQLQVDLIFHSSSIPINFALTVLTFARLQLYCFGSSALDYLHTLTPMV